MAAPAGPYCTVPESLRPNGLADGNTDEDQSVLPVVTSRATTRPRKVQHGYLPSAADTSSSEDTGTYSRLPTNTGVPVIRATGCGSTLTFQRSAPVRAFRAYTFAASSPKYAPNCAMLPVGSRPIESAVRDGTCAS